MTNFAEAVSLICPKCHTTNRHRATAVDVDKTVAVCAACGHRWTLIPWVSFPVC
jgi:hypothetical protein